MLMDEYAAVLTDTIEYIRSTQRDRILSAAVLLSEAIGRGGMAYVFGCGHSHMLAEETFYRAGGLGCVCPVFYEPLMLHKSASESSRLEKAEGLAEKVLEGCGIGEKDMLICASTSGVNAVPVEFADAVRKRGIPVVGISSDAYLTQAAGNRLGKHLQEVCDVCIDNGAPHGDACLEPAGLGMKMTPVSTVASTYIINSVMAEAAQLLLDKGIKPPVYASGNVPGGAEKNRELIERYKGRIASL